MDFTVHCIAPGVRRPAPSRSLSHLSAGARAGQGDPEPGQAARQALFGDTPCEVMPDYGRWRRGTGVCLRPADRGARCEVRQPRTGTRHSRRGRSVLATARTRRGVGRQAGAARRTEPGRASGARHGPGHRRRRRRGTAGRGTLPARHDGPFVGHRAAVDQARGRLTRRTPGHRRSRAGCAFRRPGQARPDDPVPGPEEERLADRQPIAAHRRPGQRARSRLRG
jgi:hypothetical protein